VKASLALDLTEVLSEPVDWRYKSFPVSADGLPIAEIAAQGWNALDGDFDLPVLVLKEHALDHNIELMAAYCREHGVDLAPHAKTPVAPQIVQRQLAAGAWAISVANLHQARLLRRLGAMRILMANQLLGEAALAWVAREINDDTSFEFACLVDSESGVRLMDAALDRAGARRKLRVLIELGVPGGRCGCRTIDEALVVARSASASKHLAVAGVETYEAIIAGELDARLNRIDKLMGEVRTLTGILDATGLLEPEEEILVTAGGSLFFDRVVAGLAGGWSDSRPVRIVLRSGSYVTHDGDEYEQLSPLAGRSTGGPRLEQALELWARVLSRPEPELAVLGFGRRDVAHDRALPAPFAIRDGDRNVPIHMPDMTVYALNDQHARARIRADLRLAPGDRVGFHISHPCTTFDNWRLVPTVDDEYAVTGAVRCYL
jgi:D-serine dehydratase